MTEQEAKEKWCPMVRVIMTPQDPTWQNQAMTNRMEFVKQGLEETRCIASNCMMWKRFPECPVCKSAAEVEKHGCNNESGFCGLAGKP